MNIEFAPVYDCETFPNVFTLHMELLNFSTSSTWEISHYRDDRRELLQWFEWLNQTQTPMISFFGINFDYPLIHWIWQNPTATVEEIYARSQQISKSFSDDFTGFRETVWERDRFAPQIDLFKIHHMDNKAKRTSLKALQINMRMENVIDMPVPYGAYLTKNQIDQLLIPYGGNDVKSTKQFAHDSMEAIKFRLSLVEQFGADVMNWNDSKIGSKILEKRLGDELLYDRSSGRRVMRQSPRDKIVLKDIIFPFIGFQQPEFQRIHSYMYSQVLTPADLEETEYKVQKIATKGAFKGLHATVDGVVYKFGTGGLHGSVEKQILIATEKRIIRDIDVKALYPNIGIQNGLAPEHLGHRFVEEYAKLPEDRAAYQVTYGKKSVQANSMKLASNGTYGNSNSVFSPFYDPKYTMTITINGQLQIAMLVEWLLTVPTVSIIQANTDGVTYLIDVEHMEHAKYIEKEWEKLTKLVLEDNEYKRMWIRDVNSYVAEDMKGVLKQKGAYWHPDPLDYARSISESQPPAWHKDLGNCVSIRAAVMAMVHNIPPEMFIGIHTDPYDFMLRIKVGKNDELLLNGQPVQKTTRYYVAKQGGNMVKVSPPTKGAVLGGFKRANKIPDALWNSVNAELAAMGTPNAWDARIHTKNKSRNDMRETAIEAGYKVAICNDVNDFRFDNVNYEWYINEAKKLIL